MVSVALVFFGSAQVPPLLASVMVATVPVRLAVAAQLLKPVPRVTAGVAGMVNPDAKVTTTWPPTLSALAVGVSVLKPTVQLVVAPAAWLAPENVTLLTVLAANAV